MVETIIKVTTNWNCWFKERKVEFRRRSWSIYHCGETQVKRVMVQKKEERKMETMAEGK